METVKHFGRVTANINDETKTIHISLAPSKAQPLPASMIHKCLIWCLSSLGDLILQGYVLDASV